jgi:haloacetate dehalogenase
MAQDMAEVMTALGHETFHVVGHDRGGRVGHRLARDHGSRVRTLTVLDISPTWRVFQNTSMRLARAFYHWFFLIQPAPMPEKMIGSMAAEYLLGRIGRSAGGLKHFPRAVQREYLRCFDRRGIHASCEDYRAAASIDLAHDRRDLGRKLRMPVLALWARHSPVGTMFDCLADWREVARDVRGRALDCGHFLPEEKPRETLAEIRRFLARHEKAI